MRLAFDEHLASRYKSASQRARILTEHWVYQWAFCPNCGHLSVDKYGNNQPVADFFCSVCQENYELKSKQHGVGAKIIDGSYRTKMERLRCDNNPNLFVLTYDLSGLSVLDFFVIPKHFFVPEIIERRKPLAASARRAGWVGSNILLKEIPQAGKIFFVRQRQVEPKDKVLTEWKKTLFLRAEKEISARGWLLDIMRCVEKIRKREFQLADLYAFKDELSAFHPDNKHVKDKIRQQLQILRDKGYLEFSSRGLYRLK